LYLLRELNYIPEDAEEKVVRDICASFQRAIIDVLVEKTIRAAEEYSVNSITVAGGVAANRELRGSMRASARLINAKVFSPRPLYCADNAAMIGIAAHFKYKKFGMVSDLTLKPVPSLAFMRENL